MNLGYKQLTFMLLSVSVNGGCFTESSEVFGNLAATDSIEKSDLSTLDNSSTDGVSQYHRVSQVNWCTTENSGPLSSLQLVLTPSYEGQWYPKHAVPLSVLGKDQQQGVCGQWQISDPDDYVAELIVRYRQGGVVTQFTAFTN